MYICLYTSECMLYVGIFKLFCCFSQRYEFYGCNGKEHFNGILCTVLWTDWEKILAMIVRFFYRVARFLKRAKEDWRFLL